uniref:Phospholipid transfer protein n=1 Tax=Cebus imitator TaxID=2715852 RepID=A0A2K5SAT8_CEBIM
MALYGALFLALLVGAHAELPGCKIRVTSKALELVKQEGLRFLEQELETITIPDLRGKEGHFYYNISEKVYEFLSTFITSGMRFLLNQQICPVLYHAGTVLLNSLLDTIPVRSSVDDLVGIDYSLMKDPVASTSNLDMDFRGAFFPLTEKNWSLPNRAVEPQLQEEERMVYVAFSEFFFDSAMESYFRAGALQLSLVGDKVPHDLDMLLRASYFGSIVLLFRIYSNQSALESLALIPLQAPLKTLLQIGVMPMLNERTWRGVQIPLPEGIDFVREVVTNHAGFLTIGADLHFAKGLREVIEKNRSADVKASTAPPPSTAAV